MAFKEIRKYYNDFKIWHSKYTNMTFLAHHHTEVELVRISNGSSDIIVNNTLYTLKKGDILIIQSDCIHYSEHLKENNEIEFILIDPTLIQSRSVPIVLDTQHITAQQLKQHNLLNLTEQLFSDISCELEQRLPFYENVTQNSLRKFFYLLMRYFTGENKNKNITEPKNLTFISDAIDYIKVNFSENISLEQIAKLVNVNAEYFSRTFSKIVGLNFVTYRNLIRLQNSITLLQETNKSISDIAFECGFNNIRTFNRTFIQYTSKTPIEFRKNKDLICPITVYPHKNNSDAIMVENDSEVVKINI